MDYRLFLLFLGILIFSPGEYLFADGDDEDKPKQETKQSDADTEKPTAKILQFPDLKKQNEQAKREAKVERISVFRDENIVGSDNRADYLEYLKDLTETMKSYLTDVEKLRKFGPVIMFYKNAELYHASNLFIFSENQDTAFYRSSPQRTIVWKNFLANDNKNHKQAYQTGLKEFISYLKEFSEIQAQMAKSFLRVAGAMQNSELLNSATNINFRDLDASSMKSLPKALKNLERLSKLMSRNSIANNQLVEDLEIEFKRVKKKKKLTEADLKKMSDRMTLWKTKESHHAAEINFAKKFTGRVHSLKRRNWQNTFSAVLGKNLKGYPDKEQLRIFFHKIDTSMSRSVSAELARFASLRQELESASNPELAISNWMERNKKNVALELSQANKNYQALVDLYAEALENPFLAKLLDRSEGIKWLKDWQHEAWLLRHRLASMNNIDQETTLLQERFVVNNRVEWQMFELQQDKLNRESQSSMLAATNGAQFFRDRNPCDVYFGDFSRQ